LNGAPGRSRTCGPRLRSSSRGAYCTARCVPLRHFTRGWRFADLSERLAAPRQSRPVCCISAARIFGEARLSSPSCRAPGREPRNHLPPLRPQRASKRPHRLRSPHRPRRVPGQAPTLVREPLLAERGGKRAFTFAAPSSRSALVLHGSVPGFEVVLEDAVDSSSGE